MDKITKLSQAIRYGSTFIVETTSWLGKEQDAAHWNCGCALGTACLAVNGTDVNNFGWWQIMPLLNKRFGVPLDVLEKVSFQHSIGRKTRAQCADYLESLGY